MTLTVWGRWRLINHQWIDWWFDRPGLMLCLLIGVFMFCVVLREIRRNASR